MKTHNPTLTAVGMMSGTSADGIDVALITTNGREVFDIGPSFTPPSPESLRHNIRKASIEALSTSAPRDQFLKLEDEIELAHLNALQAFLSHNAIAPDQIDIIAMHGQTLAHKPEERYTLQIGRGRAIAEALPHIKVISDFRTQNVLSGGQGAPLVPAYHVALAHKLKFATPCVFINIGGVANLTYVGPNANLDTGNDIIGFDTGPGNGLIDDVCQKECGIPYDEGGKIAAKGTPSIAHITAYLDNPYFAKAAPKSLDRNTFDISALNSLALNDKVATLTHITARSIAKSLESLPQRPLHVVVSGGGVHNPVLMDALETAINIKTTKLDNHNIDPDAIEAQAFAFLGVRKYLKLPFTYPLTTG